MTVHLTTLIVFVIAGLALLLIAIVVLFFYPGIMIMPAGQENQSQQTIIQQEVTSEDGSYAQVNITVNDQVLIANISANPEQRTAGLSSKDALAQNEAMLFVFDNEAAHRFWMKDMKFPIDIIWINSDKIVVDIEHTLQPCNLGVLCSTYEPDDDSLYVLETVSGFAQKYGIVEGTPVDFELNSPNISSY
jgi:uncharacterized membrane protein (UPF0127 family)